MTKVLLLVSPFVLHGRADGSREEFDNIRAVRRVHPLNRAMSAFHEHCQHITRESHGNDDERAAWTTLARAIFNLEVMVTKG